MSELSEKYERSLLRRISELIPELKDPRIPVVVTVERVRLNRDFSQAKVLVSTLGDENDLFEMQTALNRASGFLQRELAQDSHMRKTPKLSFHTNAAELL